MLLQPILDRFELVVSNSSQTTCEWPVNWEEVNTSHSVGYDVGSPNIEFWREETWEEAVDEVLFEHADAWKRLADL